MTQKDSTPKNIDKWLVRASGMVLGPFTKSEVIANFIAKKYTLDDEVSLPFSRWRSLKSEPEFADIVKGYLYDTEEFAEHTMTSTMTAATGSITDAILDDVDKHIPEPRSTSSGTSTSTYVTNSMKVVSGIERRASSTAQAYGTKEDAVFVKKAHESVRQNWMRVIVLGLVAGVTVAAYFLLSHKKPAASNYTAVLSQAMTYKSQGEYAKALELLKKAEPERRGDTILEVEMAPLLIALEGQTINGRRTLGKLVSSIGDSQTVMEVYTAIGLSHLLDSNYQNADEYFQKALGINPQFAVAIYNRGVAAYRMANFADAEGFFIRASSVSYSIIASTLASLELMRLGQLPKHNYPALQNLLQKHIANNSRFRQEAELLLSYVYFKQGKMEASERSAIKALTYTPELEREFIKPYLLDSTLVEWKALLPYCDLIRSQVLKPPMSLAFWGFCQYKSGNDFEAIKLVQQAETQAQGNPYILFVRSMVFQALGREAESSVTLRFVFKDENIIGAWSMRARECENKGDWTCAKQAWSFVKDKSPRSIEALTGLALAEVKMGKKNDAYKYIEQAESFSQEYLPLKRLKADLK